ncbi:hypothetical protein EVAR_79927_1 [Eumeta japonica]|uniref:Uncharacterized protein n=1 Tax=Eumeta variegata TaxID=151549 RepID=A0A4C1TZ35_EUMVA|nr:hypothetical protein EVAR_79927_1 [Eumeta japonica]
MKGYLTDNALVGCYVLGKTLGRSADLKLNAELDDAINLYVFCSAISAVSVVTVVGLVATTIGDRHMTIYICRSSRTFSY